MPSPLRGLVEHEQSIRLGERQRLDQHAVDHAEQRRVDADAQGQAQDDDGRDAAIVDQAADGVAISRRPIWNVYGPYCVPVRAAGAAQGSSAKTRVGPPLPPASLIGATTSVNPVAGSEVSRVAFSMWNTFSGMVRLWVSNFADGP